MITTTVTITLKSSLRFGVPLIVTCNREIEITDEKAFFILHSVWPLSIPRQTIVNIHKNWLFKMYIIYIQEMIKLAISSALKLLFVWLAGRD